MVNFLVTKLGPFFNGLGVSEADLTSYLTQLEGYIYGILGALVALIVVMILAHFAKKGFRHVIRWEAAMAFLAALLVMVNSICYGPMYANVSGILNAAKVELTDDTAGQSKDVIQQIGEEGTVLVKNEGLLPLASDVKKLNVFGWDSVNPIFGGTGSAGSHTEDSVGILDSLKNAGYETNETLSQMYRDYCAARPTISMQQQDWSLPEPAMTKYTDEIMSEAKDFSDTAVIVIGRPGGEGADLPTDMNAVIKGTYNTYKTSTVAPKNWRYMLASYTNNSGSYDDFEPGESYLELSVTEENLVDMVCSEFQNVIVIVNANNAMELDWVDNYEQIRAVLLAPGAGANGFTALGEILNGSVNPSGRTADTYVKDLTQTPYFNNIGNNSYTGIDKLKQAIASADGAYEGSAAFVNYVEGIYVGYKFYETAAEEGLIKYEDTVQYPFGYGLSYTSFEQKMENFKDNGDTVSFDVNVTNTGDVAGKDTVEVYYNPPYTNGGIEKASVNLIDFGKTEILEPGKSEKISFTISKEDLASYDSTGIKVNGGGYILEAGEYTISLRSDSHTVLAEESFKVDKDIDYSKDGRSTDKVVATNQFEDYSRGDFVQLSRADGFKNYDEACGPISADKYAISDELRKLLQANAVGPQGAAGFYDPTLYDNADDEMPTFGADNGLKLADLKTAAYDDERWEQLLDQMTMEEMIQLVNTGGWQTVAIESVGKVATSDCDGPAGLNNFVTKTYGTSYPAEVLLAQTWNKDLAYKAGQAMGQEFGDAANYGWYGPAMNTHRSAFSGRNFEYYSEDGVLAGLLAANQVNGAAEHGVYAYIKHFALNDQETNREGFLMTFASEQAIREIYLKPFELCIKNFKGESQAVMSSYNWIGNVPSCANSDLLVDVLRGEWGFQGMVITDYNGGYGYMITDHAVRNGNDLMLGYGRGVAHTITDQSATLAKALRTASKNIMYTIVKSGAYEGENVEIGTSNMDKLFQKINIIGGCVIGLIAVGVIVRYVLKKKKAAKAAAN